MRFYRIEIDWKRWIVPFGFEWDRWSNGGLSIGLFLGPIIVELRSPKVLEILARADGVQP